MFTAGSTLSLLSLEMWTQITLLVTFLVTRINSENLSWVVNYIKHFI